MRKLPDLILELIDRLLARVGVYRSRRGTSTQLAAQRSARSPSLDLVPRNSNPRLMCTIRVFCGCNCTPSCARIRWASAIALAAFRLGRTGDDPVSRPGESHPEAESPRGISPRGAHRSVLEPLDSHGSCHPLKAAAFRQDQSSSSCCPLTHCDPDAGDLPPSLHGHYPASSATTEQSAPGWRIGTFGLAVLPLVPFPLASPTRFSSSVRKPGSESRLLYTGHRMASK